MMISEECSFKDFLEAVRGTGGIEMLELAHREITQTQRLCLKGYHGKTKSDACCNQYAEKLKGFILFLRHGIKVSSLKDIDLDGFERVC